RRCCRLAEGADRREEILLGSVFGEEDLHQGLGFEAWPGTRLREPVRDRSTARVRDRVDGAPALAAPLSTGFGESGGDEAFRFGVHVALCAGPEIVERETHLSRQVVRRVLPQREEGEDAERGRGRRPFLIFTLNRSIHCSCQEYTQEAPMDG